MPEHTELELEQLWFVPAPRLRARAATDGFYSNEELLLRKVDRFLRYELPERVVASEFSPNIAPVSLTFAYNGKEQDPILVRKIYTGVDAAGRSGAFFTHLIAGLPPEFSARDAISLWYCPGLWVESDSDRHPQDIYLEKIPYSKIRSLVEHSQTSFNVAPVSEPLQNLLVLILTKGMPQRILIRGHSAMIAPLIYGLTHALPTQLLPGLTFTTYEGRPEDSPVIMTGTINAAGLQDIAHLQVHIEHITWPVPEDVQRYVTTACTSLMTGDTEKLFSLINEFERAGKASVDDLITLFNRRFRTGPLKPKLLEDIVLHPAENMVDITNPDFQREAAQLLLSQPEYWRSGGQQLFQQAVTWLRPGAQAPLDPQSKEVLAKCIQSMIEVVAETMHREVSQGIMPTQAGAVLGVLAHPSFNADIYLRLLTQWSHGSIYRRITSDQMWSLHYWLLCCAKMLRPLPAIEQVHPWLRNLSWTTIKYVLEIDLPREWEHLAIFELLHAHHEIPETANALLKQYEAKFHRFMQASLRQHQGQQQGDKDHIQAVLRLFAAIVKSEEQGHDSTKRVNLLLTLVNDMPGDAQVIESLFAAVTYGSPHQLTMEEFYRVLTGSRSEMLAAGDAAPSLMKYLQEYLLTLSPLKLDRKTTDLLAQLQRSSATLPTTITDLVSAWLAINTFKAIRYFDDEKLHSIQPALLSLATPLRKRGLDTRAILAEELAPHLIALAATEYQITEILDIFEEANVVSSWEMLNVLGNFLATIYPDYTNLSRLFPYVIVGIREYARSKQPQSELDTYLQTLLAHLTENALDLDKALALKVWPESIQAEWKGWRERSRPSLLGKIRSGLSQPARPRAEQQPIKLEPLPRQQPSIPLRRPEQQASPLPDQASQVWKPAIQPPAKPMETRKLPAQQPVAPQPRQQLPAQPNVPPTPFLGIADALAHQPTGQELKEQTLIPASKKSGRATGPARLTITVNEETRTYTETQYQQLRRSLILILPYWESTLREEWDKSRAKPLKFEMKRCHSLLSELQTPSQNEAAADERFVQFLADDLTIRREINHLRETNDQAIDSIPALEEEVTTHLSKFRESVRNSAYERFRATYGVGAMKNTLYALVRRYHLLLYMEERHSNFAAWLEEKRQHINIQQ